MLTTDRIAGSALVVLALLVLWESRGLPLGTWRNPGPAYTPVVLALVLLGLAALCIAVGAGAPRLTEVGWHEGPHAVVILAVCVFAALTLERLGYRLTMLAVLLFLATFVERKGLVFSCAFAFVMAFGSFFLFHTLLRVPLPRGLLGI